MQRRAKFMGLLVLTFFTMAAARADSTADTLEKKVLSAIDQNQVVNELGAGFQSHPTGEFLLAPANRDLRFGIIFTI